MILAAGSLGRSAGALPGVDVAKWHCFWKPAGWPGEVGQARGLSATAGGGSLGDVGGTKRHVSASSGGKYGASKPLRPPARPPARLQSAGESFALRAPLAPRCGWWWWWWVPFHLPPHFMPPPPACERKDGAGAQAFPGTFGQRSPPRPFPRRRNCPWCWGAVGEGSGMTCLDAPRGSGRESAGPEEHRKGSEGASVQGLPTCQPAGAPDSLGAHPASQRGSPACLSTGPQ